ncbi:GTP cyclohydrolase II [Aspergillus steynii IBT 23096]|uniref:GTP cyclohydrolase II n=1 Tax=Aspergillus steynii IBT 23096 TaxID=1392250 RepID=A0A2I2GDJ2_9EURO|nr:GTP cyclohydrolase II [Aspergillus steynii IBT 23096]PLB50969.1 GTP cyclohydrolase II [Aspergillus steynii IBT 23096]
MYTTTYNTELPPNYGDSSDMITLKATSQSPSPVSAPIYEPDDTPRLTTPRVSGVEAPTPSLPTVECTVRARIPTTTGSELWLHLYRNDTDDKEHLAFVFGNQIQSRSLNRTTKEETEMERMVRGAYRGTLSPERISSHCHENNGSAESESSCPVSVPKLTLVRVHSECYTGETAWSARCDCGEQLDQAARMVTAAGNGVIVYLRQEGRGIGLADKLKAYNLQDMGLDTVDANLSLGRPADGRTYGIATAILVDLGLGNDTGCSGGIQLLTNNPEKMCTVEGLHGEITVKERVPIVPEAWQAGSGEDQGSRDSELCGYLQTKIDKMGHLM